MRKTTIFGWVYVGAPIIRIPDMCMSYWKFRCDQPCRTSTRRDMWTPESYAGILEFLL